MGSDALPAALPDYEITQELGRGAMGVVYLGVTERLTVWPSSRNCLLPSLPTTASGNGS